MRENELQEGMKDLIGGDGNVQYFEFVGLYTGAYICQNLLNYKLKISTMCCT